MKYKCLVFDHDDTVVDSSRNVHYPCFLEYSKMVKPNLHISLEEYMIYNFDPGVFKFFSDICGYSKQEFEDEYKFWLDYASKHTSKAFVGLKEIMDKHKSNGGIIAVVSHSHSKNILKDYAYNDLPTPDVIYGIDRPKDEVKPSPVCLYKIMEEFKLQSNELLVIDDLKPGLDMARAANVDFAAAGWCFDIPANTAYMKQNADYFCKEVKDLSKIIFKE